MTYHVIAVPTDEDGVYDGKIIGIASTEAEAVALCEAEGYTVISEGEGGQYNTYDADDAPMVYGFEADGMGAIGVTVKA